MIQSIQKIIKIGSSAAVTIPAKGMKRDSIAIGDEVEVIIRPVQKQKDSKDDTAVTAARSILKKYKTDFKNLSSR